MDEPTQLEQDLRATAARIEHLLDELRAAASPRVDDRAEELLRLVTDLYGAGLARIIELLGTAGSPVLADLAGDDLIVSLMLVHGLHPDALSIRVERALDKVRPVLEQHGGDVEVLDIDPAAGAVHLRLLGSCDGWDQTLEQLLKEAGEDSL